MRPSAKPALGARSNLSVPGSDGPGGRSSYASNENGVKFVSRSK